MGNIFASLFRNNNVEFNLEKEEVASNPIEEIENMNVLFSKANSKKKAILIGVNYTHDKNNNDDLYGCENDMNNLKKWIKDNCYFNDNNIITLDSKNSTKNKIINELSYMVEYAHININSELWLSYSGHGTYLYSNKESDNRTEGICPSDYLQSGIITDDYLNREFISKLPHHAKLFILMDCCHSGSNMDLPFYYKNINTVEKRDDIKNIPRATIIKLSGCLDRQVSIDYFNKYANQYQGAFTNSFIETFTNANMIDSVLDINDNLRNKDFEQISELSLSSLSAWDYKLNEN
jgi:hypothetical protein